MLAVDLASAQAARGADAVHAPPLQATSASAKASPGTKKLAAWVVANADNKGLPFLIVDKAAATVFVSDPLGRLVSAAPALLGLALGDDSPPGIGNRALASITPQERITPAGRFVAALGTNLSGKEILWVDYDAAISLHPVVTTKPSERRLQRLATRSPADNRISYGCINVPADFFRAVVQPLFKAAGGIVYILPETRPIESMFPKIMVGASAPARRSGVSPSTRLEPQNRPVANAPSH